MTSEENLDHNGTRPNPAIQWGTAHNFSIDYRSDMITTPSTGMLSAMENATLNDNVFREDTTTLSFKSHMALLCGHEDGAFVITGTMANQIALRTLLGQPPHAVRADSRAHILHFEGASVSMSRAAVQTVRPSNGRYMRLKDIEQKAVITDDVHKCPTQAISIENTAGGSIVPLDEIRRISDWARSHDIRLHLDGDLDVYPVAVLKLLQPFEKVMSSLAALLLLRPVYRPARSRLASRPRRDGG